MLWVARGQERTVGAARCSPRRLRAGTRGRRRRCNRCRHRRRQRRPGTRTRCMPSSARSSCCPWRCTSTSVPWATSTVCSATCAWRKGREGTGKRRAARGRHPSAGGGGSGKPAAAGTLACDRTAAQAVHRPWRGQAASSKGAKSHLQGPPGRGRGLPVLRLALLQQLTLLTAQVGAVLHRRRRRSRRCRCAGACLLAAAAAA